MALELQQYTVFEPPIPGSSGFSPKGHRTAFLPVNLPYPLRIRKFWIVVSLPVANAHGLVSFAVDPGLEFTKASNYPVTQNAAFGNFRTLGIVELEPKPFKPAWFDFDPAIVLRRDDGIIVSVDQGDPAVIVGLSWGLAWEVESPIEPAPPICVQGGNDAYVKLLLHADSVEGSKTVRDYSRQNYTIQLYGDAHVSIAQAKFGTSSLSFSGAGTVYAALWPPGWGGPMSDADWAPGAGDWTFDAWVRPNAGSGGIGTIVCEGNGYSPFVIYQNGGAFTFSASTTGAGWNVANGVNTGAAVAGQWTHLAAVRSGGTILLFNNGVQVGSVLVSGSLYYPGVQMMLGSSDGPYGFNGFMAEPRWSKGVARWTSGFTPPTAAYC